MGKSLKKKAKRFIKSNGVLLASIAGVTAGFAITFLMGTGKAKELMRSTGTNIRAISGKIRDGVKEQFHVGRRVLDN